MVEVSIETAGETEARLRRVMAEATLDILEGHWCFREFSSDEFPAAASPDALALVRDHDVWSQLVPASGDEAEIFTLFCLHFEKSKDNSGFVGWLATHLKTTFGTGVFVVCGYNASRGGIYDYWGCPSSLAEELISEVRKLNGNAV